MSWSCLWLCSGAGPVPGRGTEEALAAQQLAVEAARKSGDRWSLANCLGGLAYQLNTARRYSEALAVIQEALPLAEIDDFLLAGKYYLCAQALSALGRHDEAIEAAGRAIDLGKRASTLQRQAEQHDARAQALERTGRLDEALADARSSIEILETLRARLVPRDFMKQASATRSRPRFPSPSGCWTGWTGQARRSKWPSAREPAPSSISWRRVSPSWPGSAR